LTAKNRGAAPPLDPPLTMNFEDKLANCAGTRLGHPVCDEAYYNVSNNGPLQFFGIILVKQASDA